MTDAAEPSAISAMDDNPHRVVPAKIFDEIAEHLDPTPPGRWRTGTHWHAASGVLATVVESGVGEPAADGRRDDDRLIGSLLAADATLVVDAVNGVRSAHARGQEIADQRDVARATRDTYRVDRDRWRADATEARRERDEARAEVDRLTRDLATLKRTYDATDRDSERGRAEVERLRAELERCAAPEGELTRQILATCDERDRARMALEHIAAMAPVTQSAATGQPWDIAAQALARRGTHWTSPKFGVAALSAERDRYRDALRAVATAGPEYDLAALARDALDVIEQPDRGPETSTPTTTEETP
jgi:hypothetical protein